ncbi:MAG: PKD domain-containing protein [Gemmatimonadaceae bacterium]|nr:PKD domain-containing protein [Chitinophagaceae bacterium]
MRNKAANSCRLLLIFLSMQTCITSLQGQSWNCADEKLRSLQQQLSPGFAKSEAEQNLMVREYMKNMIGNDRRPSLKGASPATGDTAFIIPVVVHVVYPQGEAYGTGTNISYAQIRSQIEALNAAFGMDYPTYNGQAHPTYAQNTRIRFCLARFATDTAKWHTGPGGTEFGVKRYPERPSAYNHYINANSANELLRVTHPTAQRFPFQNYLNIWLVKTIDGGNNVMGYAPRPIISGYPLDGVVMRADIFGDNTTGGNYPMNGFGLTQGKILAHELGHYLNLYHIFQGGCAGANPAGAAIDGCDINGDMICDIEPASTQNVYCTGDIPNSCTANYATGTTDKDMINDYMSYADDDCMNTFTLNQSQRMWTTLQLQRQILWSGENLAATGVLGSGGCVPPFLNAKINVSNSLFCANTPVTFSNPDAGNTATSFQWQFPGGSISAATTRSATVTYSTPGNYKVYLTVNDATNQRTDSLSFTVFDCKPDPAKAHMANWFFGDYGSIDFRTGAPVQTTTALVNNSIHAESSYPGQLPYFGASLSVSDSLGNTLFYSNGVSVWNGQHRKISKSPIFGTSDINASSSTSYVPYPGKKNVYFVAGAYPNFDNSFSGVRYAMVDVNADSVYAYREFQHPMLPVRFSQYVVVVPHCNGEDYWLVAKGYGISDTRFFSFLVTKNGIDQYQQPVVSIGFSQTSFGGSGYQLKANPDGTKLALSSPSLSGSGAALYDFDSRTGQIKNEKLVPKVSGYNEIQTGIAFSPNGEFFYLFRSTDPLNGRPYWLFQYRVKDFQYNIIPAPGFYFCSPFQLGPDKQLYSTTQDHYFVRISNPDTWSAPVVNGSFINMPTLDPRIRTGISMPNFIDARQPKPSNPEFSFELTSCNTYRFTTLCFENYTATWNFGDGTPVQTGLDLTHAFAQAGEYSVTLTLSITGINVGAVTKKVIILSLNGKLSGPTFVCTNGNHPYQYYAPAAQGATYEWKAVNGTISGSDNFPYVDIRWNNSGGLGKVLLTIRREGCSFDLEENISISKGPDFVWLPRDSVCINDSSIVLNALPHGGVYEGPGIEGNKFNPAKAGLGNHVIRYTYFEELVCLGQIEKTIKVRNCNIAPTAQTDCKEMFNSITVAPNPVLGSLHLRSVYQLGFVQVYNSFGQKVAEGKMINNRLALLFLSAGNYYVLVFCEKNQSFKALRFRKEN